MNFVIVPERRGHWTWELRTPEGAIILKCTDSFASSALAEAQVKFICAGARRAKIAGLTGDPIYDPFSPELPIVSPTFFETGPTDSRATGGHSTKKP